MAPEPLETCAEHNLYVADEQDQRADPDRLQRAQWLRAAILGANDGLLSTTALMLGIGAAKEDRWSVILSGVAGAVAGACSMAVGEFVSVSTQRDIEKSGNIKDSNARPCGQQTTSPVTIIKRKLSTSSFPLSSPTATHDPKIQGHEAACESLENASPAMNSRKRLPICSPGRSPLMRVISEDSNTIMEGKLTAASLPLSPGKSPVMRVISEESNTKAVDKPGDVGEEMLPNPFKAATASALAFLCGSCVPLFAAMFVTNNMARNLVLAMVTSIALLLFGGLGAHIGGAQLRTSAMRVLLGGWIAMAISYGLLKPFDRVDRHEDNEYAH